MSEAEFRRIERQRLEHFRQFGAGARPTRRKAAKRQLAEIEVLSDVTGGLRSQARRVRAGLFAAAPSRASSSKNTRLPMQFLGS